MRPHRHPDGLQVADDALGIVSLRSFFENYKASVDNMLHRKLTKGQHFPLTG